MNAVYMLSVCAHGCVCSVQLLKCVLVVFFAGYVCLAYGFLSVVCDCDLCVASCVVCSGCAVLCSFCAATVVHVMGAVWVLCCL